MKNFAKFPDLSKTWTETDMPLKIVTNGVIHVQ